MCDFPLQTEYMLRKFSPNWNFFFPLCAHAGVHAITTFSIVALIAPELYWLAILDFIIHFIMDRVKSGPKYLGRYKALTGEEFKKAKASHWTIASTRALEGNKYFWWSLGLDQMVHHLTHYFIIYKILT